MTEHELGATGQRRAATSRWTGGRPHDDLGRGWAMTWSGTSWGSLICDRGQKVETPVGARCAHCEERIETGDRGVLRRRRTAPDPLRVLHAWHRRVGGSPAGDLRLLRRH